MYPGNHTESEILSVPRNLKTRPGAPETHLAYITDDEADLLEIYKPDTPHTGPYGIPNYDTWGYDPSGGGTVTGGSTADGGGAWSGDTSYRNPEPEPWSGSSNSNNISDVQDLISVDNSDLYGGYSTAQEQLAALLGATGQIGGGLSGGTYTKGPVVYPKQFYTAEGWSEVRQRGWSSKLKPEFQYGGKWSITNPEMDQYGRFQTLPEGVVYSTSIGNPERGWGGYKRVSNFTGSGSGGSGGRGGGYYGGRGGGGGGRGGGMGGGKNIFGGDFAGENPWGQSHIQEAWIRQLRGYNRGGIVSLCQDF